MATQKGIIGLDGTLDGLNFYMLNGKRVVRRAGGGFTSQSIKTSPNMARIRENSSEFGHCSRVKKIFKQALFPFFGNHVDGSLHGRMMTLFTAIKDCDGISERGKRSVGKGLEVPEGQKLLQHFAFTDLALPYTKTVYNETTHALNVSLLPRDAMAFGDGATHLELRFGVMVFDFEAMEAKLYPSDMVRFDALTVPSELVLTPAELPTGDGMRINVISYRYVQEMNGAFYGLKEKVGVRVLGVV